ncbi:MAG TPA: hypothetical protein VGG68_14145 [Caulobacteraceae bacterium]
MVRLTVAIAILALAGAAAAAPARHHLAPAGHHHVDRQHIRQHLSVDMRDDGRGTSSRYASRTPGQIHLKPSVDTRFGHGAVASFGYHPGVVPPTLGPHELNGAAEPQLGHSESSAGVTVKIPL